MRGVRARSTVSHAHAASRARRASAPSASASSPRIGAREGFQQRVGFARVRSPAPLQPLHELAHERLGLLRKKPDREREASRAGELAHPRDARRRPRRRPTRPRRAIAGPARTRTSTRTRAGLVVPPEPGAPSASAATISLRTVPLTSVANVAAVLDDAEVAPPRGVRLVRASPRLVEGDGVRGRDERRGPGRARAEAVPGAEGRLGVGGGPARAPSAPNENAGGAGPPCSRRFSAWYGRRCATDTMFLNVSYPSICRTARCFAWSCTERIQSSRDAFASSRDTFGRAFDIAADDRPEPRA